jgi:hypothetical protein
MHLTTSSPQKHHSKTSIFAKTPAKTPIHHAGKMWGEETNL